MRVRDWSADVCSSELNLINGGYQGAISPINPRADEVMGKKCYKSVKEIPRKADVAVFAIPAKFVAQALEEVGQQKIPGDRKSVLSGKRVPVRVDLGGRRIIQKQLHPLHDHQKQ